MQRKPIILILTSHDEVGDGSKRIAAGIKKIGSHNAVIVSDVKYDTKRRASALDRILDSGGEYQ